MTGKPGRSLSWIPPGSPVRGLPFTLTPGRRTSSESPAGFGEGVVVGGDGLIDDGVGGLVFVFTFELAIKPASEIAQGLSDGVFGVGGHVLCGGAVALDGNLHAVFVAITAPMSDVGAELVEVAPLRCLQGVRDGVKLRILWSVRPDFARRVLLVGVVRGTSRGLYPGRLRSAR
jgi:hypothetical protein